MLVTPEKCIAFCIFCIKFSFVASPFFIKITTEVIPGGLSDSRAWCA
jgi:hypothetical protein